MHVETGPEVLKVERKKNRVWPSPEDPRPGGLSKTRTVENKQL